MFQDLSEHSIAVELLQRLRRELELGVPPMDKSYKYSSVDASGLYGTGWQFRLKMYWARCGEDYLLDLVALHDGCGYLCSRTIAVGTKDKILERIDSQDIIDKIAEGMPKVKKSLEESMRDM